jgi:protein-tyrosine phosphatase
MTSRLYTVRRSGPGRLSTMARPRGSDWLADELAALCRRGVDVLVCALTDPELADLELTGEAQAAQAVGLVFVRMPIPDRGVLDRQAVQPVLDALAAELAAGRHVVVHCRYGIGRASLLAGALLVREGWDPEQVWAELSRARGYAVPDTDQQRIWVAGLNAQPQEPF